MDPAPASKHHLDEITKHTNGLRKLARGLLYDRASADDVVQTAWLVSLRAESTPQVEERAWLSGIVRKLSKQRVREEARRRRREEVAARSEAIDGPHSSMERLELTRLLVETVQSLDEPYRTVILWRYFDDLSPREIAKRRGVPLETVRTQLKRGLEQLRSKLGTRSGGSTTSLLGALAPLAGTMPFAWKFGTPAASKATIEGVGAIVMSTKAVWIGLVAIAVAVGAWTFNGIEELAPLEASEPLVRDELAEPAVTLDDEERLAAVTTEESRTSLIEEVASTSVAEPDLADLPWSGIRGRVLDASGEPITGVNVSTSNVTWITDEDGRYELKGGWGGQVSVQARGAGWSQAREWVQANGPLAVVEFDLVLRPEFRVVGRVLDESGSPVEGAEVTSFYTHDNVATTGPDGRYVLGSLDPGRPEHSLTARKPGFVRDTRNVNVEGRQEAELDLELASGLRVEGVVVSEDGEPIEGAELYIGFSPFAYDRLDATVDEEGAFVFPAVGRGDQTLVTQRRGYAADHRVIHLPAEGSVFAPLEIVMNTGHYLGGRILDEDGAPIEGLQVSAQHLGEYIDARSSTDADGYFRLEHLPGADVGIEVYGGSILRIEQAVDELDRDDLVIHAKRSGEVAGTVIDGQTGEPVPSFRIRFVEPTLEAGDTRTPGYGATWSREGHLFTEADGSWSTEDEKLKPGTVIGIEASAPGYGPSVAPRAVVSKTPDPAALVIALWPEQVVRGTVTSKESGEPLSGVSVKRFTSGSAINYGSSDDVHGRIMGETDSHGRFELRGVPAGEMSLAFEHGEYALTVDGPFEVPRVGAVTERQVSLGKGSRLFGRLIDAEGRPLAGELVQLATLRGPDFPRREWEQETGPDGGFDFTRLPAGPFQLGHQLQGMGYSSVKVLTHRVVLDDETELEHDLRPSGTITLLCGLECDEDLPSSIPVRLTPIDFDTAGTSSTHGALSSNGRFELRGLEPGAYQLSVSHYDFQSSQMIQGTMEVEVGAASDEVVWLPVTVQ